MAHGTTEQEPAAPEQTMPPDIETMRDSVRLLLREDAEPLALDEVDTLALTLRGHIELLIPEVEYAAGKLDKDDVPRYCALACVGEARGKLRAQQPPGLDRGTVYARKLARSLNALCDHHENLGAERSGAGQ